MMTELDCVDVDAATDPAAMIAKYLRDDDAVIRCAAAKAFSALKGTAGAPALIEVLVDEDPDVRTDVMEALVACARPDGAAAILKSLEGDPVKEVKIFAVRALARLDDPTGLPLILRLARDRADDEVAWEDEAGMWDDWLDVQIAAIEALGRMQASEAIDHLLEARIDELGQELDDVIFPALAAIEGGGMTALLSFLRDRDPKVRERVVKAMGKARPDTILPMRDVLLSDAHPAVRKLAIPAVDSDSRIATDLVRRDPDATVREAAIAHFATARPDLVKEALRDADESVRATALDNLAATEDLSGDLAANLQAWMGMADAPLAARAADVLPDLIDTAALPALSQLAKDEERPLEARIAALKALGGLSSEDAIEPLQQLAAHVTRQIRATALTSLVELSQRAGPWRQAAECVIVAAIRGEMGSGLKASTARQVGATGDVGASKVEQGPARIRISEEGEIIELDDDQAAFADNVVDGNFPTSTLGAIQTEQRPSPADEEGTSSDVEAEVIPAGSATKRRRVAVEGPDDIADDIRAIAIGLAANCASAAVDQALLEAIESHASDIRHIVLKALSQRPRSARMADELIAQSIEALSDSDPAIRGYAAAIVEQRSSNAAEVLGPHLDDADPWVRAAAFRSMPQDRFETFLDGLRDESALVRKVALEALSGSKDDCLTDRAIDVCLAEGRSDTLQACLRRHPELLPQIVSRLARKAVTKRDIHTALETIAGAGS